MLTTRVYRPARPAQDALEELRRMSGTQFCPRCVSALDAIVETEMGDLGLREHSLVD
jgi:HD-GYP domain-containing protein (c-di-GMP phosphodiesterase class II)